MSVPDQSNPYTAKAGVAGKPGGAPAKTNGLAIASLVLGLVSLVFSCFTGLFGIILGIIALVQIGGSNGAQKGTGLAITGMLLSFLFSLLVPVAMLLPAVGAVRQAARRTQTMNNMRQIQLAQLNYESAYQKFPSNDGGLSWRVHILPFIEQNHLYDQFRTDEPWDSAHNLSLLDQMPEVYDSPGAEALEPGKTRFLRPVGNGAAPLPGSPEDAAGFGFGDLSGGSSNTFAVLEVDGSHAVNWTEPADYTFDPENPMAGLGSARVEAIILAAFYDGSVQNVSSSVAPDAIKSGMTFEQDGQPPGF